jgi:hypothetical protein
MLKGQYSDADATQHGPDAPGTFAHVTKQQDNGVHRL